MNNKVQPPTPGRYWSSIPTRIVALVAACDEERFIGSLVLAIRSHVDEVIVVDDGSIDNTAEIARYAGATVLQHTSSTGRAAAIHTGLVHIRQAMPAALLILDGGSEHYVDDIPRILAPITAGQADIVTGHRVTQTGSVAGSASGEPAVTTTTSPPDLRRGLYALGPRAIKVLEFDQFGLSFESQLHLAIKQYDLDLVEIPLVVVTRVRPRSSPLHKVGGVLGGLFQLMGEGRPLLFFGASGLVIFILGGLLGIYLTRIYAETQRLAIGYGLLTVLLCVVGTVLFFAGVILHSTRAMMLELRRSLTMQGIGETEPDSGIAHPGDELLLSDSFSTDDRSRSGSN